jgi:OOP family OmpA-OmpF porin
VDAKGCPSDQDGDGVDDGLDKCADTPKGAVVDSTGCPKDSDGDGVFDGLDKCADTPKGAVVDSTGCPKDSDGDGVPDGIDQCPDTPVGMAVNATGCPTAVLEMQAQMLDTGQLRFQDITFETGKAVLQPSSNGTLDAVGLLLVQWPQLKVEIGGHTDSKGAAEANQKLSQTRAQSVKDYLAQKYPTLKADQLSVKGYGESKPVVPNTSADNMAKNRRVEFVVLNKDVLKQEAAKRGLTPTLAPPPPMAPTPAPADTTKH